ncbi:hypothetical protein [Lactiplantibacillus plantarum]|uniref:hypothetical protein n=1 Tax=Lactiplantibacillus plantarum TaxID=1590 RepID=UPI0007BB23A5|nr:hypothetical protein [Lactiplantibacillus plantarum]KZU57213.1 hypothetical protein Nizo2776_0433 [Lactiplantibacillus plantarum]
MLKNSNQKRIAIPFKNIEVNGRIERHEALAWSYYIVINITTKEHSKDELLNFIPAV